MSSANQDVDEDLSRTVIYGESFITNEELYKRATYCTPATIFRSVAEATES